ncbi:hypothetical protein D3C81_1181890 [compost metagenome]
MRNVIRTMDGFHFGSVGPANAKQALFKVNPGVDAAVALEQLATRLDVVAELVFDAGMGEKPLEGNHAWLAHYTLESISAALFSIAAGLDAAQGGEQ